VRRHETPRTPRRKCDCARRFGEYQSGWLTESEAVFMLREQSYHKNLKFNIQISCQMQVKSVLRKVSAQVNVLFGG
jgi:hypothetical protein